MRLITSGITFFYKILRRFSLWLLVFLLALWLLYPTLQFALLKQFTLFNDISISVANVDFSYNNKILGLSSDRIEVFNKQNRDILAVIKDVDLRIDLTKLLLDWDLFSDVKARYVLLDIDKLSALSLLGQQQDLQWFLGLINQGQVNDFALKFNQQLQHSITANYHNYQVDFSTLTYDIGELDWFKYKNPSLTIKAYIDFSDTNEIKFIADVSNNDFVANTQVMVSDNIHVLAQASGLSSEVAYRYLPDKFITLALRQWLDKAFLSGKASDINLDWQYQKNIDISAKISGLDLMFHPDWPVLKDINGTISSDGKFIYISGKDAQLASLSINSFDTSIDIDAITPLLKADIKTINSGDKVLDFLTIKALDDKVPKLDFLTLLGTSTSLAKVVIPLSKDGQLNLDVSSNLSTNEIEIESFEKSIKLVATTLSLVDDLLSISGDASYDGRGFKFVVNDYQKRLDIELYQGGDSLLMSSEYQQIIDLSKLIWQMQLDTNVAKIKAQLTPDFANNSIDIKAQSIKLISDNAKPATMLYLTYKDLPNISLSAENIDIDNYHLPRFDMDLLSNPTHIEMLGKIYFNSGLELNLSGLWQASKTHIDLKANGNSLQLISGIFSKEELVKDGAFDLVAKLSCNCSPWEFRLDNISGALTISTKEAVLLKQNANLTRILSLLNIKALSQRLSLDVSDAFTKGFNYETLALRAALNEGVLVIENFDLVSFASNIDLSGDINLTNQQLKLNAKVTPLISDSVPVLAYLSSGSLLGFGAWLLDKTVFKGKIMSNLLDKPTALNYQVGGSLDEPIIK